MACEVHAERPAYPPQPERKLIILPENASRHGHRSAQQRLSLLEALQRTKDRLPKYEAARGHDEGLLLVTKAGCPNSTVEQIRPEVPAVAASRKKRATMGQCPLAQKV